jgi:hypothetical protein
MSGLLPGGFAEVMERNRRLCLTGRDIICRELGITPPPDSMIGADLHHDPPASRRGSSPAIGAASEAQFHDAIQDEMLRRYSIQVPFWGLPSRPDRFVPFSAQLHNSEAQYRRLAEAIKVLLEEDERPDRSVATVPRRRLDATALGVVEAAGGGQRSQRRHGRSSGSVITPGHRGVRRARRARRRWSRAGLAPRLEDETVLVVHRREGTGALRGRPPLASRSRDRLVHAGAIESSDPIVVALDSPKSSMATPSTPHPTRAEQPEHPECGGDGECGRTAASTRRWVRAAASRRRSCSPREARPRARDHRGEDAAAKRPRRPGRARRAVAHDSRNVMPCTQSITAAGVKGMV